MVVSGFGERGFNPLIKIPLFKGLIFIGGLKPRLPKFSIFYATYYKNKNIATKIRS
jgi:hypothetical protein